MLYVLVLAIVLILGAFYVFPRRCTMKGKVIPGPKGFPLIGCVLELNENNFCAKLKEFAEAFGDIFQFRTFSKNCIVLNSQEMIYKAFVDDKYKRHFNDRPKMFYGVYFRSDSQSVGFAQHGYGTFYKKARMQLTKALYTYGSKHMDTEKNVMIEMKLLIQKIEEKTYMEFQCMELFKRSLSNVMSLLLSGKVISDDDPDIDIFWQHVAGNDFFLNAEVDSVMTLFPFLRFLPGKFGNMYRKTRRVDDRIKEKYFHDIKNTYIPGQPRGMVDHYIDEQKKEEESGCDVFFSDERIIAQILEIIDAGITTSWAFLTNSMLVLMNYPEIQTKIQEEIDRVIGNKRLPTYTDRNNCHYLRAFEMEMNRYLTIAPVVLPHLCKDNVEFCGYDIEANSVILANIWYVHHDEDVWGDPWTVRPERFLDDKEKLLPKEHKLCKNVIAFGIGRRQCTGEMFAKTHIFLYLSTLLQRWTFGFPKGMERSCDPRITGNFEMKGAIKSRPFFCKAVKRFRQ